MLICKVTIYTLMYKSKRGKLQHVQLATNCKYDLLLQHLCNSHKATYSYEQDENNWQVL